MSRRVSVSEILNDPCVLFQARQLQSLHHLRQVFVQDLTARVKMVNCPFLLVFWQLLRGRAKLDSFVGNISLRFNPWLESQSWLISVLCGCLFGSTCPNSLTDIWYDEQRDEGMSGMGRRGGSTCLLALEDIVEQKVLVVTQPQHVISVVLLRNDDDDDDVGARTLCRTVRMEEAVCYINIRPPSWRTI